MRSKSNRCNPRPLGENTSEDLVLTSNVHYAIIIKETIEDWMIIKRERESDEPDRLGEREREERSVFMFAHTHEERKIRKKIQRFIGKETFFKTDLDFLQKESLSFFYSLQRDAADGSAAQSLCRVDARRQVSLQSKRSSVLCRQRTGFRLIFCSRPNTNSGIIRCRCK